MCRTKFNLCCLLGPITSYGVIPYVAETCVLCCVQNISGSYKYSAIQKDGLKFTRLYFLNYTWYVNELHNI